MYVYMCACVCERVCVHLREATQVVRAGGSDQMELKGEAEGRIGLLLLRGVSGPSRAEEEMQANEANCRVAVLLCEGSERE